MSRLWDAKLVSPQALEQYLDEGWEPLGAVETNPMAGGARVQWAIRRTVQSSAPKASLGTLTEHDIVVMKTQ